MRAKCRDESMQTCVRDVECTHLCMQHTRRDIATHCNTLQHTATHCNTLQHTATHCNTLQHCMQHTCRDVCFQNHISACTHMQRCDHVLHFSEMWEYRHVECLRAGMCACRDVCRIQRCEHSETCFCMLTHAEMCAHFTFFRCRNTET